jgi:16S rRNA (guanine966-N2)-methyltransferase
MVRISSGLHRGRQLRVPPSGVRPTKDMVRQALFSVLGESIAGKRMVDLFAGTGVIGLEALSRGAAEAVWVESDARTFKTLKQNIEMVCGPSAVSLCFQVDAMRWLLSPHGPAGFDLIVADPPYNPPEGSSWGECLLEAMTASPRLKPEGLFVLEQRNDQPVIDKPGWDTLKEGRYGETRLVYYRRTVRAEGKVT